MALILQNILGLIFGPQSVKSGLYPPPFPSTLTSTLTPPPIAEKTAYMLISMIYLLVGIAVISTIIELMRRQYNEAWRKMQELRAQIQAQLQLAATLKQVIMHDIQGTRKKYVFLAKQDPGRARQNS